MKTKIDWKEVLGCLTFAILIYLLNVLTPGIPF